MFLFVVDCITKIILRTARTIGARINFFLYSLFETSATEDSLIAAFFTVSEFFITRISVGDEKKYYEYESVVATHQCTSHIFSSGKSCVCSQAMYYLIHSYPHVTAHEFASQLVIR